MEDTRKYFDYELAYEGYKKVEKLLNKGGIDTILNDGDFEISGDMTIEDCINNGYMCLYGSGYNANIILTYDMNKQKWNTNGEIDIYSYGGGDDHLLINDESNIIDRLDIDFLEYAQKNGYQAEDIYKEYNSLKNVLQLIRDENQAKLLGKGNICKGKLIKRLYDFWVQMDDNINVLNDEISNLINNEGKDGAEVLLDWCRNDYETIREIYMTKYNLNEEQMEKVMDEHCGTYDFMVGEVDYDICGLEEIWNLCNYYLDYCNEDITEEDLLTAIEN